MFEKLLPFIPVLTGLGFIVYFVFIALEVVRLAVYEKRIKQMLALGPKTFRRVVYTFRKGGSSAPKHLLYGAFARLENKGWVTKAHGPFWRLY